MTAFSSNSFFHVEIWLGCRLYFCANSATVLSPLAAASFEFRRVVSTFSSHNLFQYCWVVSKQINHLKSCPKIGDHKIGDHFSGTPLDKTNLGFLLNLVKYELLYVGETPFSLPNH
ncbi:hypothetical protein CTH30272_00657 [Allocatenococcus thiocycli]|nr:hypothetical protein CTH30272_00657 [Catenococcus thiocycli]